MRLTSLMLFVGLVGSALSARILGLLPMPSRSHGMLMERLIRELGNRGHTITYITASPVLRGPIPNATIIDIPDVHKVLMQSMQGDDDKVMNMFSLKGMSGWFMFLFTLSSSIMANHILTTPKVQDLIKSDEQFDLIIAEAFLDESIFAGFSHRFQAPVVALMSFMPNIWANYLTGNPAPSAYVPDPNLGLSSKMTFFERLHSFLFTLAWDIYHPLVYLPSQDKVMKKHFGADTPDIHSIIRNTSLVLINHHFSLGFPRAYLPNMVEVAGMHINPVKPLPAELQKFLDEAKEGAILFSMGSNLKSSDMSPEMIKNILTAFGALPYKVLWKFEENLPFEAKNVKIGKWLPQSDILAHPNLKLFITHGGMLSTTEAVYRGVPVLGIPIFGDQPLNMKHTENAGLGKTFDFDKLNPQTFYDAIMEITTDPSYAKAAKHKSSLLHDSMHTPMERAIWWVEYVIRSKGAVHLRSSAQDLAYYEVHQLDVIATLSITVISISCIGIFIVMALCRKVCCKNTNTNTNTSKQSKKKKKNN